MSFFSFIQEVETLTAHWSLYISLGGFAVGLIMVTLLGSWSDRAGRRFVLIIPSLGLAVQAIVYLIVMYLKLPVFWFLIGRICSGLSGDFNAILAGCFAYVADTSARGSRTFRVAILEACLGLAGMLASIIGGQWRRAQGYLSAFHTENVIFFRLNTKKNNVVCFPLGISTHSGWYWPQILQRPFTHTFLCLKRSPLTQRQSSSPPGTTRPSTASVQLMHRRGAELNSGCTRSASFWWCLYISAAVTSMCCMS